MGGLISEVLDIECARSVNGEFRGFELMLCLRGYNVYLSYRVSQSEVFVRGFWVAIALVCVGKGF